MELICVKSTVIQSFLCIRCLSLLPQDLSSYSAPAILLALQCHETHCPKHGQIPADLVGMHCVENGYIVPW